MSNYADTAGRPRRFNPGATDADMGAPTDVKDFINSAPYPEVLWYVSMGVNVTSYSVSIYRWSKPEDGKSGSAFPVLDDTFTLKTGSESFRQPTWGDLVSIRIHDIVDPDGAFEVRWKGINPQ